MNTFPIFQCFLAFYSQNRGFSCLWHLQSCCIDTCGAVATRFPPYSGARLRRPDAHVRRAKGRLATDHTAGARTLLAPAAAERRLMHKRAWRPLVRLLSQPCSSSQVLFRLVRRFGFTRANKVGNEVNSDDLIKNSHFGGAHAQFFT